MDSVRFVHLLFLDGVGLGDPDPDVNPFVTARLPHLDRLLGEGWFLERKTFHRPKASFAPTDPNLGVRGRPQSATGQATILTGRNVPHLVGGHYGPKPNQAVADVIEAGTLFHQVVAAGGTAALITPYPPRYFEAIESGRRLFSAVPLAATSAGLTLMTEADLRAGRAISPDFTGQGWRDHLGYDDTPLLSPPASGQQIAAVARRYTFSFFEHWPSDQRGHRGTLAEARAHLELIDAVLGGLFAAWPADGLLIITSDHGNIEAKDRRQHTRNPVPTIIVGPGHAELASQVHDLTDIAPIVRTYLGIGV